MTTALPEAWADLIQGLTLLAAHQHDQLTVMADPDAFSSDELAQLEELGFHPGEDQTFYSFRFGSA